MHSLWFWIKYCSINYSETLYQISYLLTYLPTYQKFCLVGHFILWVTYLLTTYTLRDCNLVTFDHHFSVNKDVIAECECMCVVAINLKRLFVVDFWLIFLCQMININVMQYYLPRLWSFLFRIFANAKTVKGAKINKVDLILNYLTLMNSSCYIHTHDVICWN